MINLSSGIFFLYKKATLLFLTASTLLVISPALATHIVGGQIEMLAVGDKPGHFRISVTYYFDETQTFAPRGDEPLPIYRKRDNQVMDYIDVYNQTVDKRPLLPFTNQPCATQRNLTISVVRYTGDVQLKPEDYNDSQGYYITYQTCCRNGGIDNIQDPVNAGYVFYLEFPALKRSGQNFINSSPIFNPIDGEYICLGEPFTFDFDARDPDGDELRYSLITPLAGFLTQTNNQRVLPGPYPEVRWLAGYNPTQAIPGTPPLQIDPRTGQLSVTATRVGLYIFTVQVEEYRKGERIGAVRRDYQLLVVDCPPTTPPDPKLTIDGQELTSISFCDGHQAQLQATSSPDWMYQWKKDGTILPTETSASLIVKEAGVYQLVTTLKAQCAKIRRSPKITVTVTKSRFQLTPANLPPLCKPGQSITLTSPLSGPLRYKWYQNGQYQQAFDRAQLEATQPGLFWAVAQDTLQQCESHSDTIRIQAGTPPLASVAPAKGKNRICVGDSVELIAQSGIGYSYQWYTGSTPVDGATKAVYTTKQGGGYWVSVTDSTGCQTTSTPVAISLVTSLTIQMDPIAPICLTPVTQPVTLTGYPSGGRFEGPGVKNGVFTADLAGVGLHTLRYIVEGELSCQQGSAKQDVVVHSAPKVDVLPSVSIWRGGEVLLPLTPSPGYIYQWSPSTGLNDPTVSSPLARPAETTTYQVTVQDSLGCTGQDSIQVQVYDRVWVPDAFSPDGDGINDTWVLRGLEAYPDAEVTIYNRWGEIIFYSKGYRQPFDGIHQGKTLPSGLYTYLLTAPGNNLHSRGTLVIL